jgi:hypothetical protein
VRVELRDRESHLIVEDIVSVFLELSLGRNIGARTLFSAAGRRRDQPERSIVGRRGDQPEGSGDDNSRD